MCVEVERTQTAEQLAQNKHAYYASDETDHEVTLLGPAVIQEVNENGELRIKLANSNVPSFWLDATSPHLHPCGYWKYLQKSSELSGNPAIERFLRIFDKGREIKDFRVPVELHSFLDENKMFDWERYIVLKVFFNLK
jgi:hypothetical protein